MNANQNTALIIIDIQNDYFEGGAYPLIDSEKAVINAKQILEYFRSEKLPIVHIQHLSTRSDAAFFLPETKGAEIHELVKPLSIEKLINKYFPNSFIQTDLQQYLVDKKISNIVFCGMMTSMCIDATVRAAKDLNYNCTLIADACAAPDICFNDKIISGRDVNTTIVGALSYYYATVVNTNDFIK